MKTNKFKTLIIQKNLPLKDFNHQWGPNSIIEKDPRLIGNKIEHKDFGVGVITNFHEEGVVLDFEIYGVCQLRFPMTTSRFKWIQFKWNEVFVAADPKN